jgi:GTP diphosphokinase / guanosine-3',5'-bis(diphosphate) 3'-diphosphatase
MMVASYPPVAKKKMLEEQLYLDLVHLFTQQKRSEDDLKLLAQAYRYGFLRHLGQKRKTGENYITHPLSVGLILTHIPMDTPTVLAGILHDTIEDTTATPEEVRRLFGEEVLQLVEGVTKLGKYRFSAEQDPQAENFRKMFLSMAQDSRIIVLKLADRLHNMKTLDGLRPDKQRRIASETLEIFAPLANRIGMGNMRAELEDLSFKYLHPDAYEEIRREVIDSQGDREDTLKEVREKIMGILKDQHATIYKHARIKSRVKNAYSIYKKMMRQQKTLNEVYDISAIRVIVKSEPECYEVLGVIHSAFQPIPGRFKDYIALPKNNQYQSLHTTVIGPKGKPLEFQVRTEPMHRVAEYGIAAHWVYKDLGGSVKANQHDQQQFSHLQQMLMVREEAEDDARSYVDAVKLDLFSDQVFVFTPKGRLVNLPLGSTAIDFAYQIHTEVGHTCSGAMVNGKLQPLDRPLKNGDIVEILTNKKATPRLDWINMCATHMAKSRIRQWFKRTFREQHHQQGRSLLEAELTRAKLDEVMKSGRLVEIARELNYHNVEDLLVALGYGECGIAKVLNRIKQREVFAQYSPMLYPRGVRRMRPSKKSTPEPTVEELAVADTPAPKAVDAVAATDVDEKLSVESLHGVLYHVARCCRPVPGDAVVGLITRSRGVMIHRDECENLRTANAERQLPIQWSEATQIAGPDGAPIKRSGGRPQVYPVTLEVEVIDRLGVLKDILTQVADTGTNVTDARVKRVMNDQTVMIELTVEVEHLPHLHRVFSHIRRVPDLISLRRGTHRPNK